MSTTTTNGTLPNVKWTIDKLISEFNRIPEDRKPIIRRLTDLVANKSKGNQNILLNFICTHNSRRSHIAQIWAQAAAHYYNIKNVQTFSGGTEASAFNPRAVVAMKQAGFDITSINDGENPVYKVKFADSAPALDVFSKKYDDDYNPKNDFAAIMTCSHADENCPLVLGASTRIVLTYDDPKDFDGTPLEAAKYTERVHEIGREILYAFSQVRSMSLTIRSFKMSDWPQVSNIYQQGLATRKATFETTVPDFDIWIKKFNAGHLWVAESNDHVVGWAGLQPVSVRKVYEGVVEVTIYVHSEHSGKGIGKTLMSHLVVESEKAGIWTLFASIFPENGASIHLHQSAGFRKIGFREKIAQLDGKWQNTLLFERRSEKVGV